MSSLLPPVVPFIREAESHLGYTILHPPDATRILSSATLLALERSVRGLATMLLWLRLGQLLAINDRTGPLLRMVMRVLDGDVRRYTAVQLLFVVSFASFFTAIYDIDDQEAQSAFGSMHQAVKALVRLRPGGR